MWKMNVFRHSYFSHFKYCQSQSERVLNFDSGKSAKHCNKMASDNTYTECLLLAIDIASNTYARSS